MAATKPKRPRQLEVPGTQDGPRHPEIVAAAENYEDKRDQRIELNKHEKSAEQALIEAMKRHKVKVYRDNEASPPIFIELTSTDKVKVSRLRAKPDVDEGTGELHS